MGYVCLGLSRQKSVYYLRLFSDTESRPRKKRICDGIRWMRIL